MAVARMSRPSARYRMISLRVLISNPFMREIWIDFCETQDIILQNTNMQLDIWHDLR